MAEILEAEFGNRRDDIRIITRNARRLERLTQDILDVTRIESQSLNLVVEKFDIGELIETLVQDYRSRVLNGDGNDLQYLQKEESLPIEGDKERLTQVITNFVDNALRFTKNGQVYVTAEREPDGVRVSVGDTGIGIDAYILPRLFTKFASKAERGTGLGLFISKSIIEAHGGKIWGANNSDGKGATFAFAIPSRS
jgi:signal transduction histidine kinase